MLTCHGQAPAFAASPPTILLLRGALPHTDERKDNVTIKMIYTQDMWNDSFMVILSMTTYHLTGRENLEDRDQKIR